MENIKSCAVPKVGRPADLHDYRPVALTPHMMKTLERLILRLLRPQTLHTLDPLHFGYREHMGVDDAVVYMLHRAHSYLNEPRSEVRILFLDFSSAFNTIQPSLLREKLELMGVEASLMCGGWGVEGVQGPCHWNHL